MIGNSGGIALCIIEGSAARIDAQLNSPAGVFAYGSGVRFIADVWNNRVRKVFTGLQTPVQAVLSTTKLSFDSTQVGATAQQSFTIANTGTTSLSVTGHVLLVGREDPFVVRRLGVQEAACGRVGGRQDLVDGGVGWSSGPANATPRVGIGGFRGGRDRPAAIRPA